MKIKTKRLILRPWEEQDLAPLAKLNGNPQVMEYFSSIKSVEQSNEEGRFLKEQIAKNGWGFWAVSAPGVSEFIGFIGIKPVTIQVDFAPSVEIGWRLDQEYWGKGYATEGALASLQYGFEELDLKEIVSMTTVTNSRSRRVMETIGMTHYPKEDFDHPKLPENHALRRHVLYRLTQDEWSKKPFNQEYFLV